MANFAPVPTPDEGAQRAVIDALAATPRGSSFGRLVEPAAWLAGCQAAVPATSPRRTQVVVFEGGHGVGSFAYEGVGLSAFDPSADAEHAAELAQGSGPLQALAHRTGAKVDSLRLPDSAPIDSQDAMDAATYAESLQAGVAAADRHIDSGADLFIPAEYGVGASAVAATLMGVITKTEPVAIVGTGLGTTDAMWKTKVTAIRDAMFRARHLEGEELLQVASAPSVVAMVGFLAQAAVRRTPMLIDTPLAATAAVFAERLAPGAARWMYATSATTEPAHVLALQDLDMVPLLSMEVRSGMALGALAALPLIESGIELAADQIAVSQAQTEIEPE